jgi:hypothetical protein
MSRRQSSLYISVMVLGCDTDSLGKFMGFFPHAIRNERTKSMTCMLKSPESGVTFKISSMSNTATRQIETVTTLPPRMFKSARTHDTIAVIVYDFDSEMSSDKAMEVFPKSLEQACHIFSEKYKSKFRLECMMSDQDVEVRPPLQSIIVGFSSKGKKTMTEAEFRAKLVKECAIPDYSVDRTIKKQIQPALVQLKEIDCFVIPDLDSAENYFIDKLQEKYDFRFTMTNDGTVKKHRKKSKKSARVSDAEPSQDKCMCVLQ